MRLRNTIVAGIATLSVVMLSACSSGSANQSTESSASHDTAVATTIEHAFGTTQIPEKVERVATVNWANQDVPLALGVMPVGFAAQTWGVEDDSQMLEWTKKAVEEMGAEEAPVLFDETDGVNFEAVAATNPDVILASYSGLTKEDYDKLSAIAPTVAYPTVAWGTPWREMITMNSKAINKVEEGDKLVADLEKQIADEVAKYPELEGKTAAFFYGSSADMSQIGYYTTTDPRTAFLADLGLGVPESVKTASEADPTSFYVQVSAENVDQLSDVDVIVMYGEESELAAYQGDALIGTVPAIKNGAVVFVGNGAYAASTNPTALSIPWGISTYVADIAKAAAKVK
ncbi:iron-siderophore ABC transporter substrate-binding protein [Schaalia vaccimaxillae]|uniref:iron-siderophore ABC transporter substrate-binding protein n=1 Tax=Schaalia vaccimaxillae TaxID=183916 RepID=UPI0003B37C5B|nr:iron-siderophore ABC transporter substrate-binding protein [Schaalia vaccimaxillae]